MKIDIISAVPESIEEYLNHSIIKIAREKGILNVKLHNLHDFSTY